MATQTTTLQDARFAVLDRPVCVWDPELAKVNLQFLQGLDPEFFLHQADATSAEAAQADQRTSLRHALALRISFGMALEALFAVLGAVVQAPHCVFGWLSAYRNDELLELVRRIDNRTQLLAVAPFRPATWENISSQLTLPLAAHSVDAHQHVSARFAQAWKRFAHIFTDRLRSLEYNSLKHGFRVQPSGFTLAIRPDTGDKAPLFQSASPLGHMLPYLKKNDGRKADYSVSTAAFTLEPAQYVAALSIVARSIKNAVAVARLMCGDDPSKLRLSIPQDSSEFDAVAAVGQPIQSFTYGGTSTPDRYYSDAEILAVYDDPETS